MGRLYCRTIKVAPASRPPGVGRTLLSDAFDLDFWPAKTRMSRTKIKTKRKTKFKGVGQECPTHPPSGRRDMTAL